MLAKGSGLWVCGRRHGLERGTFVSLQSTKGSPSVCQRECEILSLVTASPAFPAPKLSHRGQS